MEEVAPHFLSHLAREVGAGALVGGVGEQGFGDAILDEFAQVHKHRLGGDAACLSHVVGDDEDGDLLVEHILHLVPNGSLHLQAGDKLLLISER